jgi:tripartite-type tricarboxylate transporter receptor subunit TctC
VKTVTQLAQSKLLAIHLEKNGWDDLLLAGDEFKSYIESEQKSVQALVSNLALVKK